MLDFTLLLIRATVGTLMAGHGAQKLSKLFGGNGIDGTAGFMEMLGLKPGRQWAILSGTTEAGGGILTLLGFLNPLGPIGIISAMSVATVKVHWNKPIWAASGGAELPVVYAAAAALIGLAGPGKYSLDHLAGVRTPKWLAALALLSSIAGIAQAVQTGFAAPPPSTDQEAGRELQAGDEAAQSA